MKKIIFISIIFFGAALNGYSQKLAIDSDNLSWTLNESYNSSSQETLTANSEFITRGSGTISLVDHGTGQLYQFSVQELQGSWQNLNEDGTITFKVYLDNVLGTLKFQKENGVARIYMEFKKDGKNIMPFIFLVANVTKV